jgi:TrmH family RNA methyltransferase
LSTSLPKRISGRDNPEFKRFLAVRARKNRDLVLVEGPKLLEEAIRSNISLLAVAGDERASAVSPVKTPFFWFSPALMKSLSDVETHQGVLALVERPRFSLAWLGARDAFVLILNGLQDPGNVGTLFRTAEAAGVTGILLTRGCADPMSPKALRASAGSAFRVPHVIDLSVEALLELLPPPIRLAAAVATPGALSVFETSFTRPSAVALGAEGSGLDGRLEAKASMRIRVPFAAKVESLNVAAAGAVILFEMARQAGSLRP